MAVLATDTFTRADGASLGANWTVAKGVTEELGILTNQAKQTTAGATAGNYYSAVAAPNDQYSQAVVVALTNYWLGVTVRSITTGASRNAYVAGQDVGDFGGLNTTSRVWKEIAGVVTSLGTGATTLAAGQTWYLEVQGTQLIMKINGVQEISTPGTGLSAGQFGIQSFNTGSGGIAVLDTWEGGDFSSTASNSGAGSIAARPGGSMGPRMRRALPQLYPDSPVTPVELTQTPAAPIPAIALGPRRRRSIPQQYADTPVIPVELTQSPAAPFRPGRGPGMGPMLLRRNLAWPLPGIPAASTDVTVALTGVEGTGAVGTFGVQHDQALTGNEATGSVGTLTPATSVALTGLSATGSVGTLAPSTTVALTGVAGTISVGTFTPGTTLGLTGVEGTGSGGTLAPSTTVTLTGNEATVSIGTLFPSGDVTVALTGVSAIASIGDLSPSGADVAVVAVQPVSVGGSGVASRPIQDKYWREIEQRYKKKKKQAEKKSKIAVEIIEDIARRGGDLEDALQELKAELAEEHIRQAKVYVELLKLKLDLAEADEEEEEAVTLLASEEFRL